LAGQVFKATPGIPVLPVIEKPWGDVVAAHELGCKTDPAQELLNNLAFILDSEFSARCFMIISFPCLGDAGSYGVCQRTRKRPIIKSRSEGKERPEARDTDR
jgi:hypothetical protein